MTTTASARSAECAALLKRSYEGEVIGTAMYAELLEAQTGARREALELLRDMEGVTADALTPLLGKYGVTVDDAEAQREGRRLAEQLKHQDWTDMWREVVDMADDYLRDFEKLEGALDTEDAAIGRQVVEHEVSMIEFARIECSDDPTSSLNPLHDYLRKYTATP